jgi:hypothetical protein
MSAEVISIRGGVPDHDLDAERAVLASVLLDQTALERVPVLGPEHFYLRAHARLFDACQQVAREGGVLDPNLVISWLRARGKLAEIGGSEAVAKLLLNEPEVGHVEHYARIVREAYQVRQLDTALAQARLRCQGRPGDRRALLAEVRAQIEAMTEGTGVEAAPIPFETTDQIPDEIPPIAYVSERLHLAPGRPACLVGYSGAGKTLLAACLALAVAAPDELVAKNPSAGVAWGGIPIDRRGKVLMLDLEVGSYLTKARINRLAKGRWALPRHWKDRLGFACMPNFSLVHADAEAKLTATLKGITLCIIDSLTALTPGVDENSKYMADHMALLTRVSEATGCAILVLHHEGKPPADGPRAVHLRGRGHSSIQGIWSSQWAVSTREGGRLVLEHGKTQWNGGLRPSWACQILDVATDKGPAEGVRIASMAGGDTEAAEEVVTPTGLQKAKRLLLDHLEGNGPTAYGALKDDKILKKVNNTTFSKALRELVEVEHRVTKTPTKTPKGTTTVYALAATSQPSSQPPQAPGMNPPSTPIPTDWDEPHGDDQ